MTAIVHQSTTHPRITRIVAPLGLVTGLLLASPSEAAEPRIALLAAGTSGAASVEVHRDPRRDWTNHARCDRHGYDCGSSRGHARDHDELRAAHRYAAEAVDQAREARRLGRFPDHPRWSLNYERHFEWALRASSKKMAREHHRRAAQLRQWRREAAGWYEQRGRRPW